MSQESRAVIHPDLFGPRPATKYYAVAKGAVPGIYSNWLIASPLVIGFKKACYKSFMSWDEAKYWMAAHGRTVEYLNDTKPDLGGVSSPPSTF